MTHEHAGTVPQDEPVIALASYHIDTDINHMPKLYLLLVPVDKQVLVEFGADPDEVAEIQSLLKGRAAQKTVKAGSRARSKEGSDDSNASDFSLAETTPRSKRKFKIPDAFLPKVAIVGRPNVGKFHLQQLHHLKQ